MEVPAGLWQEVAASHRYGVATHHGPDALPFDDEPEGVLGVPMLGGVLARHQVLDRRPERGCGEGPTAQRGIGQGDRPPLATPADRHELSGLLGESNQVPPPPEVRRRRRPGSAGIRSPISVQSGTSRFASNARYSCSSSGVRVG